MKNKLKLLLLPVILIGLTACSKNENYLEKAFKNMDELKSYHTTLTLEIGMESQGISIEIPSKGESDVDLINQVSKTITSTTFLGVTSIETEYTDLKSHITYKQNSENPTQWYKEKESNSNNDSDFPFDVEKFKKIGSTEKEIHYQITLTPDELKEGFNSFEDNEIMSVKKDTILNIYIDKHNKLVSKVEVDLSNAIEMENTDIKITKASFSAIYSNFNNVSLSPIDQSIIDNAIEVEE